MKKLLGLTVVFEEVCGVCKGNGKDCYFDRCGDLIDSICSHCRGKGTCRQEEILSIEQIKKLLGLK